MTRRPSAHTRIAAALHVIDEYNRLSPNRMGGIPQRNYNAAINRLAAGLNELFGPLPPEPRGAGPYNGEHNGRGDWDDERGET